MNFLKGIFSIYLDDQMVFTFYLNNMVCALIDLIW